MFARNWLKRLRSRPPFRQQPGRVHGHRRAVLGLEALEDRCVPAIQSITEYPLLTAAAQPFAIVKGPDGNLWFTEEAANTIARISTSGAVTQFPIPTASSNPLG